MRPPFPPPQETSEAARELLIPTLLVQPAERNPLKRREVPTPWQATVFEQGARALATLASKV